MRTDHRRAFMRVTEFGVDSVNLVRFCLGEPCLRRMDWIYSDLPLSYPSAPQSCECLEMLGFFFTEIIPEMFRGDVRRLQYHNCVDIDPKGTSVASDCGRGVLTTCSGQSRYMSSAALRRSSLNLGWAMLIISSARSRVDFPFRLTTPNSVTR